MPRATRKTLITSDGDIQKIAKPICQTGVETFTISLSQRKPCHKNGVVTAAAKATNAQDIQTNCRRGRSCLRLDARARTRCCVERTQVESAAKRTERPACNLC